MSYTKTIYHNKTSLDKISLEIELQKYISTNYDFCPKIIEVIHHNNRTDITMEAVNGLCLAKIYSDNPIDIPSFVWKQIHKIISSLFYNDGIEYIDISSYNFMMVKDKVYIIDFGHAYWCDESKIIKNWFLHDFIEDELNEFNPDFF
jgi:tRNA A-37 threonylcarbamoyl transferase component Bud32